MKNMTAIENTDTNAFHDRSELGAAYQRRLAEIETVSDAQLVAMNLDVHGAATTVLGVLPKVAPFRAAIAAIPQIDQHLIDGLEDYAHAAQEADARYVTATLPREDIAALNDEAAKLREILRADTVALAKRGLVDPAALAVFKGQTGYRNVARDLIEYAVLLGNNWDKIHGNSAIRESELQYVKELGERLSRAAGEREQAPVVVAETADIRQRALTLLLLAYDETRRAIQFLRFHDDDAESITPSLYAGRGGRGKPADDAVGGDPVLAAGTPDEGTTPAGTTPAGTTAAGARLGASSAVTSANAASASKAAPIPIGMPGSSPFIR